MKLYFLEWDNGSDYDDQEDTALGIYTSEERREEAKTYYSQPNFKNQWPFNEDGDFVQWEAESDKNLVAKHPKAWVELRE